MATAKATSSSPTRTDSENLPSIVRHKLPHLSPRESAASGGGGGGGGGGAGDGGSTTGGGGGPSPLQRHLSGSFHSPSVKAKSFSSVGKDSSHNQRNGGSSSSPSPAVAASATINGSSSTSNNGQQQSGTTAPTNHATNSAGAPSVAAIVPSPKQMLCIEMLTSGHVHSFVDFFYLTHEKEGKNKFIRVNSSNNNNNNNSDSDKAKLEEKKDSERERDGDEEGANDEEDGEAEEREMSEKMLRELKDNLTEAETSLRQGDAKNVIRAYKKLAQHFADLSHHPSTQHTTMDQQQQHRHRHHHHHHQSSRTSSNYQIAIHFHQKCLDISHQMSDTVAEGAANRELGMAYEKIGDVKGAIRFFEEFLELASKSTNTTDHAIASRHLVHAYHAYAQQCEAQEDHETAVQFYRQCVEKAQTCGDVHAEGQANYRLGLAYKVLGDHKLLVQHLTNYLEICRQQRDEVGEGIASSALAAAFQGRRERDRSVEYLEQNILLAERTGQLSIKAEACRDLGIIYNKSGDYPTAVEFFEKYFEIARSLDDEKMADKARVFLGIAKGNMRVSEFLSNVQRVTTTHAKDVLWQDLMIRKDE